MVRSAPKNTAIQIRASDETKALLNRAASIRGQSLSDFVLQSARREAEETILDQRVFVLSDEKWDELMAILDAPPAPNEKLRELMRRKPAWER